MLLLNTELEIYYYFQKNTEMRIEKEEIQLSVFTDDVIQTQKV